MVASKRWSPLKRLVARVAPLSRSAPGGYGNHAPMGSSCSNRLIQGVTQKKRAVNCPFFQFLQLWTKYN